MPERELYGHTVHFARRVRGLWLELARFAAFGGKSWATPNVTLARQIVW